jgi:hypothetical protein
MAKSKSVFSRSVWESIWLSQEKKCAQCGKEVELKDTGKRAYSFEVVCKDCYAKPQISFIVYDELSHLTMRAPDAPQARSESDENSAARW